jgi:hypothetical protein
MKTAELALAELVHFVRPPRECVIVLTERASTGRSDPNWVAASGIMDPAARDRFSRKIAELQQSDPQVDWASVPILFRGRWRAVRYLYDDEQF